MVFKWLRDGGDCSGAQGYLDEAWVGFDSPRNVVLFQAVVHVCAGRTGDARREWTQVKTYPPDFGEPGGRGRWNCGAYRALGSVVEDRPLDEFQCGTEAEPSWGPERDDTGERTDPRVTRSSPNPYATTTTTPVPEPTPTS